MARRDDSIVGYVIGFIILIIFTIGEAFDGNFIPVLVAMGIIFMIYIFIKVSKLKQQNVRKDKINLNENPQNDFNFPRLILILILLGGFLIALFINKSSDNTETEIIPVEEPISTLQAESTDRAATPIEIPKQISWIKKDFANSTFQIPDNLVLIDSLSTDNSRLYIDFNLNISMSIVANNLPDEMKDKTINDLEDKISILANAVNEENKRNFDDFKLLNYEIGNLGNSKAVKIVESSKKVSGLKDIEMKIISYQIIENPYYYKVVFSFPQESSEFLETFTQVNKSFVFQKSNENANATTQDTNDNQLGYYKVDPNTIEKVYFHDSPAESYKRKAYLVKNEVVSVLIIENGFGYVEYTNIRGIKSKGWLKLTSLIKLENQADF